MDFPIRLNRYLSACGLGSRRGAEALVLEGRVLINGKPCTNLGTKVNAEDSVSVNGRPTRVKQDMVIALHKPRGYVCTRDDEKDRQTIYALLPDKFQTLHHVGRLDMDSSGLILLTNRGDLSHRLTHPRHGVEKEYEVTLEKPFEDAGLAKLVKGMLTPEGFAKAERAWIMGNYKIGMVLKQGLKRQIRHMLYNLDNEVRRLVRVRVGNIYLKGLPEGGWREISERDTEQLLALQERSAKRAADMPAAEKPPGIKPFRARVPRSRRGPQA